jgi:hypothetical protein
MLLYLRRALLTVLHCSVFRDWSYPDTHPDEVYQELFRIEHERSSTTSQRNQARVSLMEAFESVSIWLFPMPVECTANLGEVHPEQLSQAFRAQMQEFRSRIVHELTGTTYLDGMPLTGQTFSQIIPELIKISNSKQTPPTGASASPPTSLLKRHISGDDFVFTHKRSRHY